MKTKAIFILIILLHFSLTAQVKNVWKDGHLTFETAYKVDSQGDESETDYDAENDQLGINMEIVDYFNESEEFLNDIKKGCRTICKDMNMSFVKDGKPFIKGYNSYFIVCKDDDYVITAVILREDQKKVYEISLYYYEISIQRGIKILKSFKFI